MEQTTREVVARPTAARGGIWISINRLSGLLSVERSRDIAILFSILLIAGTLYAVQFSASTSIPVGVRADDAQYLIVAESFAVGRPNRLINFPEAPPATTFPPGYPLFFLTPVWLVVGPNYAVLRAVSAVLALANVILAYRLLKKYIGYPLAAVITAWFALNHQVAQLAVMIMSDTAFIFMTLVFLNFFEIWLSGPERVNKYFFLSMAALIGAFWVRYQAVALVAAVFLYLLLRAKYRWAGIVLLGFAAYTLPMLLLIFSQNLDSAYAVQFAGQRFSSVQTLLQNVTYSLVNYWRTLPFVLLPWFGPTTLRVFSEYGAAWVVDAVRLGLVGFIGLGLWQSLRRGQFVGWLVITYFGLVVVLTNHLSDPTIIFDEDRYTAGVALFLYLLLVMGVLWAAKAVRLSPRIVRPGMWVAGIGVAALLFSYSLYKTRIDFQVVDITSGGRWVQENTAPDSVVMAYEPMPRFLHLRRKTVAYPGAGDPQSFIHQVEAGKAGYLVVAPPMTFDWIANQEQAWGEYFEQVVLPAVAQHPELFSLRFADEAKKTWIYEIIRG